MHVNSIHEINVRSYSTVMKWGHFIFFWPYIIPTLSTLSSSFSKRIEDSLHHSLKNKALKSATLLLNQNHAKQGSLSPELFTPFKPFSLPSQQQFQHHPKQHSHIPVSKILLPIIWPQPQHPLWFQSSIIVHQQQLHFWWGWWAATHSHQREEAQEDDIKPRIRT